MPIQEKRPQANTTDIHLRTLFQVRGRSLGTDEEMKGFAGRFC